MGWVFLAGVAVVLICAAVFTVIERRRRAAFQKQIHDWVQTRIDQMKRRAPGMNSSKKRHDGGAYRRFTTMVAMHTKDGKDRTKARRHQNQKKGKKK